MIVGRSVKVTGLEKSKRVKVEETGLLLSDNVSV